nr:hypothetical protein [Schaalia odontolytica]
MESATFFVAFSFVKKRIVTKTKVCNITRRRFTQVQTGRTNVQDNAVHSSLFEDIAMINALVGSSLEPPTSYETAFSTPDPPSS